RVYYGIVRFFNAVLKRDMKDLELYKKQEAIRFPFMYAVLPGMIITTFYYFQLEERDTPMNSQIYQLNYDYEQQNGHFLVLESGDTEKLTSNDLAMIQVNMLKANEIEKVLPLEIEEFNFDVR